MLERFLLVCCILACMIAADIEMGLYPGGWDVEDE